MCEKRNIEIGSGLQVVVCVFISCTVRNVRFDVVCYWMLDLGEFLNLTDREC